ncbi:glycosyltransferase [Dyadobacter sp. CY347]|uniref:nucleotide disphospho-sugar-binding domain-containing protein n=1 Tax=Dyadobacter sp. CY347 TaxID=2909336 RepID=UPI001F1A915B|nr:glycosyltransferase [Dyadobacter sp. CY347]MCF2491508.1 glycosyltransferase [Dyadobacter sp. CY347]
MKKSVLFLPASIRSHVIPALYLADQLSKECDIYFAVTNEVLEEIVVRQGYNAIATGTFRVALGMEGPYVFEKKNKASKWETLKSIRNDDLFVHRQKELSKIVDRINASVIFIDIFNSTDLLVLYARYKNIKFIFLNPMLSTYRVNGFPTVDQGQWTENHGPEKGMSAKRKLSWKYLLSRPFDALITRAIETQFERLINIDGFSQKHPVATDRTSALLFENIPEIILGPLELEVSPEVGKPNQHYLGLCISENRQDTELDLSFDNTFSIILNKKKAGKRLIYCTFGTFYQGSDKALLDFLNKLLDAIEGIENVEVIFSVTELVIETLSYQRKIPNYINMFSRVPQLTVLKYADLFVTHGGLGSIKESIYYGVPMLVYPLDLKYDQNGNGLKVEHHGLGLRGVFLHERSADMNKKMKELLIKDSFRENIRMFKNRIMSNTRKEKIIEEFFALAPQEIG